MAQKPVSFLRNAEAGSKKEGWKGEIISPKLRTRLVEDRGAFVATSDMCPPPNRSSALPPLIFIELANDIHDATQFRRLYPHWALIGALLKGEAGNTSNFHKKKQKDG
jgi:hypothetical protein